MFSGTIIVILLTNDLSILTVANLFLYLVLLMNLIFGDCPISIIENQYLGSTMVDTFSDIISNNIKTNFPLEQTKINSSRQWILMAIMVCTTKVILLLIKYTFHLFLIE
jgi:hypothetical protein